MYASQFGVDQFELDVQGANLGTFEKTYVRNQLALYEYKTMSCTTNGEVTTKCRVQLRGKYFFYRYKISKGYSNYKNLLNNDSSE